MHAGEIGRIGVQIRSLGSITQYNIEGERLMSYSCSGYQKCTGPVSSAEVAVRRN